MFVAHDVAITTVEKCPSITKLLLYHNPNMLRLLQPPGGKIIQYFLLFFIQHFQEDLFFILYFQRNLYSVFSWFCNSLLAHLFSSRCCTFS